MQRISKATKNLYPDSYGYEHPWDIPGNEGCGAKNPENAGKQKGEYPEFKVTFTSFEDADGDRRYVSCSAEVARMMLNEERNEIRRLDTESRCMIPSQKYGLKKCRADCSNCPYKKEMRDGRPISLDMLYDEYEYELGDESYEQHEDRLDSEALYEEVKALVETRDTVDKALVANFDKTDVYIAELTNTTKQLIGYRRKRLIKYLQEKFKK